MYQIPQIIYSSLISEIIITFIKFLGLTENILIEIKNAEKISNSDIIKIKSKLKIKFILFYIISFLLLLAFSYYISCFCGTYINTQIHLIKDTFMSFGLSLVYPFGTFLLPGIFRINALKNKNNKYIYKFSQFIEDLL